MCGLRTCRVRYLDRFDCMYSARGARLRRLPLHAIFGDGLMGDLKGLARRIFHETLAAIDIPATMQRKLLRVGTHLKSADAVSSLDVDLAAFSRVVVIGIGKAAHAMVDGLVSLL